MIQNVQKLRDSYDVPYSEIVVRMFPGTYEDFRDLRNQMDDELQDAVDSGAKIEW